MPIRRNEPVRISDLLIMGKRRRANILIHRLHETLRVYEWKEHDTLPLSALPLKVYLHVGGVEVKNRGIWTCHEMAVRLRHELLACGGQYSHELLVGEESRAD